MPCSPLSISMRPVQIPCRFFRQVIESTYLCRTCIEDSKTLCCLFIFIYDIVVILSGAKDLLFACSNCMLGPLPAQTEPLPISLHNRLQCKFLIQPNSMKEESPVKRWMV